MTTTAHEDQFTDAPESVRQPYDAGSILRRNVADLELALKQQAERAEKAEAELKELREQVPLTFVHDPNGYAIGGTHTEIADALPVGTDLYARPIPAPAVPDANPVQWLADEGDMILVPRGLLGAACSSIYKQLPAPKVLEALRYYTMNAPQAPAVPDGDDFNGSTPHLIQCMEALVRLDADGVLVPHGIGRDASKLLSAAANRLRQQAASSMPEEWRNIVTKMLGWWDDPAMTMSQGKVIAEKARALLQSTEVTK